MADREDKNNKNAAGAYYVDSQCIDCDLCRETAPDNFARAEAMGYSYVIKQPENDGEAVRCGQAMASCPVEAIGDDGNG
jgi:ferredoxin